MSAIANIGLTVTDPGLINAYQAQLRQAPQQTAQVITRATNAVADRILSRYRTPGAPITYPVNWQSERQRRAFFATNGFGRGIPTKRTNALVDSWRLTVTYDGQQMPSVALTNPVPYRKFVVGRYQQNMHKGRWYRQADLTRQARLDLADEIESALIRNQYAIDEIANL